MTTMVYVYNNSITYNINYDIISFLQFQICSDVSVNEYTTFVKTLNITRYKTYKIKK